MPVSLIEPPAIPSSQKQQPPVPTPKPALGNNDLSPGSAIQQAARAAAANREHSMGPLDVLSDTMGVDFGSYLQRVEHDVRANWYKRIPESARAPLMKKGKVSIEFRILKDGSVQGITQVESSGDAELDRAAWQGITTSNPFSALPADFVGQYVALRFRFYYNPSSSPVPRLDKGSVEGRTYKNASVGLELTPAPELKFKTPELKGTPGTVPLLVTVAAWGKKERFSAREGTVFYADALAYFPDDQRSTEAYMRKVVRGNQKEGFEPVEASLEGKLGGVWFARTDFKKGPVYEAILVKACDPQALVFIFTGSGRDAVNKLIAATELKLDCLAPATSKTSGAPPK